MIAIDSSSLILLAKIDMLDIVLKNLAQKMVITPNVFEESTIKKDVFDAKLIERRIAEKNIEIRKIKNKPPYHKIKDDFGIWRGEAESAVLCMENNIGLIIDDKKAIKACKILKIPFTTVANLLIGLYKKDLITKKEITLSLDKLEKFGRYSNQILQTIKELINNEKNG